jgi:hypothetical protein
LISSGHWKVESTCQIRCVCVCACVRMCVDELECVRERVCLGIRLVWWALISCLCVAGKMAE